MKKIFQNFKSLPINTRRLMSLGIIVALVVALPLFVWSIMTMTFDLRERATSGEPEITPTPSTTASPSTTPTSSPTQSPTQAPTASPTASPSPTASASPTPVAGDVNNDGVVNIVDVGIIIDYYGQTNPSYANADINDDGVVNIVDLGIIISNY